MTQTNIYIYIHHLVIRYSVEMPATCNKESQNPRNRCKRNYFYESSSFGLFFSCFGSSKEHQFRRRSTIVKLRIATSSFYFLFFKYNARAHCIYESSSRPGAVCRRSFCVSLTGVVMKGVFWFFFPIEPNTNGEVYIPLWWQQSESLF